MPSENVDHLGRKLLDQFRAKVDTMPLEHEKPADARRGEGSAAVRGRVEGARERQRGRFEGMLLNSGMGPAEVQRYCAVDEAGHALLRAAMRQLSLSARGYHRILKVGRTIADLAGSERIQVAHLAEAVQYRPRGMQL